VLRKLCVFSDFVALMACTAAAVGHQVLCMLQPFKMRNGATARFVANSVLMSCNLPQIELRDPLDEFSDRQVSSQYNQFVAASIRDYNVEHFSSYLQNLVEASVLFAPKRYTPHVTEYARGIGVPLNHTFNRMFLIDDARLVQRVLEEKEHHTVDPDAIFNNNNWGLLSYRGQKKAFVTAELLCRMHEPAFLSSTSDSVDNKSLERMDVEARDSRLDGLTNNLRQSLAHLAFQK